MDERASAFKEALASWKALLRLHGVPEEVRWIFDENLCFEKDPSNPAGYRFGYQVAFTPPPAEAEEIAYEHFTEFDGPIVFYRVGSSQGRSICLLLSDKWFESKTEAEGFTRRGDWQILFRLGAKEEVEEIKDRARWAIHETLAHGRVLTAYDRYALKLMHVWRRLFGKPE